MTIGAAAYNTANRLPMPATLPKGTHQRPSYRPNSAPVDIVDNPKSARNEEPDQGLTGAGKCRKTYDLPKNELMK
jgi:hypothetical protein